MNNIQIEGTQMSDYGWQARRPWLGTVALATLALFTGLQADEIRLFEPVAPAGAIRTLHFPPNQSVGWLCAEPNSGPGWNPKLVGPGVGDDAWPVLADARGDVVLPEGRNIELRVMLAPRPEDMAKLSAWHVQSLVADRLQADPSDLSALGGLDANDLCRLSIGLVTPRSDADRLLEPIRRLTGLQMLSLYQTGLTDRGMENLRTLRSLRALALSREHAVGNAGLAVLKDLPSLQYLDLDTQVTDVGLKTIGQLKNLRWLRIHTGRIWGPGLAELANLPHLERLCITGFGPLSDRHLRYLEGLTHLKSLTFWGIGSSLTDASLASIGKLERLEALYFVRTSPNFTAAGMAQLTGLKRLKRIDFAQSQLGGARRRQDETVRRLTIALPHLQSLQLIGPVTAEGMKALGTLRNLRRLHVGLQDQRWGYRGPTGVNHLAGLTLLEDLYLEGGQALSDQDLIHLEALTNLKDLMIHGSNMTDRGLSSIGKLKRLESLDLNASVTKGGLNQLSGLANLRSLAVRQSSQGARSSSFEELTMDLSGMQKLRSLQLGMFSFEDADLACLASLRSLEDLSIQGGYAQPRSFPAVSLQHLQELPELNSLYIGGLFDARAEDLSVLGTLPSLENVTLAGSIPDAALPALGNLQSGWSLTVMTDQFIKSQTIADLKQRLSTTDYSYVHIQDLPTKPKPRAQTIQPRQKRAAPKPPRSNRQRRG